MQWTYKTKEIVFDKKIYIFKILIILLVYCLGSKNLNLVQSKKKNQNHQYPEKSTTKQLNTPKKMIVFRSILDTLLQRHKTKQIQN